MHVAAGDWLFREGEPADSAYVVRSGRLDVVVEHPTEVVIRQLKRGAAVGELGLLRGGLRSTSVRAARDSELMAISREDLESLISEAPTFALGLIHLMAEQIAANRAPQSAATTPQTIAIVALDRGAPADEFAADLAEELTRHGSVERLWPGCGPTSDFPLMLERAEAEHDRVILVGAEPDDEWTNCCIKDADLVMAVSRGHRGRRVAAAAGGAPGLRADRHGRARHRPDADHVRSARGPGAARSRRDG